MCLTTTLLKPMVAEKDIICYKVLRMWKKGWGENPEDSEFRKWSTDKHVTLYSYYYPKFTWEFNEIYHAEIQSEIEDDINTLTQGLHSYIESADAKKEYETSYISAVVVRCIIPKGSFYYAGFHGYEPGYVSNQLIIKEIVDFKELYPSFNSNTYPYKKGDVLIYESDKEQYNIIVKNIVPLDTDEIRIMFQAPGKSWVCGNCLTDKTGKFKSIHNNITTGTLKKI